MAKLLAMPGIDPATRPRARIVRTLQTPAEQAFGQVLMQAFKQKVNSLREGPRAERNRPPPVPSPGTPGEG